MTHTVHPTSASPAAATAQATPAPMATHPQPGVPSLRFTGSAGDSPIAVMSWPSAVPPLADLVATFADLGLKVAFHEVVETETAPTQHRFAFCAPTFEWSERTAQRISDAFAAAASGQLEVDGFARLIGSAGIEWEHVVLVRAASRYLRLAGLELAEASIVELLTRQPAYLQAWVTLFHSLFEPGDQSVPAAAEARLAAAIESTSTLDEDRLLRALRSFLAATLRTNWFQHPRPAALAFKLDPAQLTVSAAVTPFREIFVHSPAVEGSHVRGGAIARGGLRHSDRKDDFRTEVLGLMKTQVVKNSLIVPIGAKGAFVVRGAVNPQSVRSAYQAFIGALLDVTDNIVDGVVQHPQNTVLRDAADPYLVVAADKGTATFSDLANSIAIERGFWLGDAFASGGSVGYDHKAMGITARGAWCSVRRHLAELGVDVDTDHFTVVGVGDMSGDVFGNGMLLSRQIQLVGAFDHRHIFLDPNPDTVVSFAERERLAALPRSSWDDYDRTAISEGGGVWPRSAKSIPLSPQLRERLGVTQAELPPHELIRALLTAQVDLLWNGGIGTYVKAASEPHSAAADPSNDSVRVDAATLRCRSVGEGGNLGFTQRARVEFALTGGKINADFIDNAAGVATSDREVNLKIALDAAVAAGVLPASERNPMLAAVTEDVARSVLADADRQTLAISLAEAHAPFLISRHERLIENLEAAAGINRAAEGLPSDAELKARHRAGTGLVRPEIATLLAQSKNLVRSELLASTEISDPVFAGILRSYFPETIAARIPAQVRQHRLAREIVAVVVANEIINRVGPGFARRLEEQLGVSTPRIAVAYWVVREAFAIDALWNQVLTLDVPPRTRIALLTGVQSMIEGATSWLLQHGPSVPALEQIWRFRPAVLELRDQLPQLTGVVERDLAALQLLTQAFPLAHTARAIDRPVALVAQTYQELGRAVGLEWLCAVAHGGSSSTIGTEPTRAATVEQPLAAGIDHWDALARTILSDELHHRWHQLARGLLEASTSGASARESVARWVTAPGPAARLGALITELRSEGRVDTSRMYIVAATMR